MIHWFDDHSAAQHSTSHYSVSKCAVHQIAFIGEGDDTVECSYCTSSVIKRGASRAVSVGGAPGVDGGGTIGRGSGSCAASSKEGSRIGPLGESGGVDTAQIRVEQCGSAASGQIPSSSMQDVTHVCKTAASAIAKYQIGRRRVHCLEKGVDRINRDGEPLNPHDVHNLASFIRRHGCDVRELERTVCVMLVLSSAAINA